MQKDSCLPQATLYKMKLNPSTDAPAPSCSCTYPFLHFPPPELLPTLPHAPAHVPESKETVPSKPPDPRPNDAQACCQIPEHTPIRCPHCNPCLKQRTHAHLHHQTHKGSRHTEKNTGSPCSQARTSPSSPHPISTHKDHILRHHKVRQKRSTETFRQAKASDIFHQIRM